jgi:exoribonuclease R
MNSVTKEKQVYKIQIVDRVYSKWTFYNMSDFKEVELPSINPIELKMFSNDVFSLDEKREGQIEILHSSIKTGTNIPAVLVLKNNKTYGRSSKNGKLLYKCIPDDMRLPHFLIPYEIKSMGFSKVFMNQYITFDFAEWTEKHPIGVIKQLIGTVDILDNFYEYQLYCKSLNASIQKFNKDTSKALKNIGSETDSHNTFIENVCNKYSSIEDRTDKDVWTIFTIDSSTCLDFDDAFSIKELGEQNCVQLSIYIANVTIWLDVLNLWESFSRRISTIYLPDRRRPMLPTILSDCLCSLQSKNTRIAFVMDIFIDNTTSDIRKITYSNCKIRVCKNYSYEESDLLISPHYKLLLDITKMLSKKYKYINNIRNSHDIVSYLMIFMNYYTAKEFLGERNHGSAKSGTCSSGGGGGIFRYTIMNKNIVIPDHLPENVAKYVKIWNSSAGQYVYLDSNNTDTSTHALSHELLEMDAYIHITSPIRRLVDLLNMIQFQKNKNMIQLSENAMQFYSNWLNDLDYINNTMRCIRRVQTDCSLLHLCSTSNDVMEKMYDGYIFDKITRNDGLFQYIVYLSDIQMASRVTLREEFDNYTKHKFKLYLFNDEENLKKKIRLQLQTHQIGESRETSEL